jgi:hypothetical protein
VILAASVAATAQIAADLSGRIAALGSSCFQRQASRVAPHSRQTRLCKLRVAARRRSRGGAPRLKRRRRSIEKMIGLFERAAYFPLAAILCVHAAIAQVQLIVDGSGADIPDAVRQEIFELVTDNFRDPLSSQFRRLQRAAKPNRYCGEVNTRNMYGAYGGFKPFLVVLEPDSMSVDVLPSDDSRPKLSDAEVKAKLLAMKAAGCRFGAK